MSGTSPKNNSKKNKFVNGSGVLQVKSSKLEPHSTNKDPKCNAKSDDDLRKSRKLKWFHHKEHRHTAEVDGMAPDSSLLATSIENTCADSEQVRSNVDDDLPLVMEYCPEPGTCNESGEKVDHSDFTYNYQHYVKNTKSIKFTNQVTVLYFNGDDVLCESTEPLKKEHDQQLRNKEMRKEHLMTKGQIDNLYLY